MIKKLSKGFTLIELLATMVIASILASSLITGYRNYNEWLKVNEQILKTITINTNERTITIVTPSGYIYAHN